MSVDDTCPYACANVCVCRPQGSYMAHKARAARRCAGGSQSNSELCALEPSVAEHVGVRVGRCYCQDMDSTAG